MVEADSDVQKLVTREQYLKSMIYFLESVLGELKSRSFHVRAAIDWMKFRAGG
jgi:prefoldin subunit 5